MLMFDNTKGLLTECEACTGKYFPDVFVQYYTVRKTQANTLHVLYFPVHTEQTRKIRHLLYGFWFIFFSVYIALCSSSDVASELVGFNLLHVYNR